MTQLTTAQALDPRYIQERMESGYDHIAIFYHKGQKTKNGAISLKAIAFLSLSENSLPRAPLYFEGYYNTNDTLIQVQQSLEGLMKEFRSWKETCSLKRSKHSFNFSPIYEFLEQNTA
ncbi:hypothetical protein CL622_08035 [archaeon]|nr:hypothetical protein [archaeon]|tara:strand:+ start:5035 stop:5388 length:354 start_codon:yes stop_codon:yes gene_type:complete